MKSDFTIPRRHRPITGADRHKRSRCVDAVFSLDRRARADYRDAASHWLRGATMKRSLGCSLTILALACGLAHADGSGTLYQDGKPLALVSAYAYRGPDPFDKTKEVTTVVFSDKKIDAAAAN